MRLLAGDIGGTKTLLRCIGDGDVTIAEERFESGAYATFDAMLREFLARVDEPIDAACFAVAGPVYDGRGSITNVGWEMSEAHIAKTFSIRCVSLINDFHGIALGVPRLGANDLLSLQKGTRDRSAPIGILGFGTGLGQAILVNHGGVYHVIPSEGGHGDFAPQDEEQARLFVHLHKQYGHVSWERVASGMGLVNIFTFLGGEELDGAEIATLAEAGDARAAHAFELFIDVCGAEAGNMALRVLARGGIYLAGGIAAKNIDRFTDGRFLEAFVRKGRFQALAESIPVDLIVNEEVGLIGAADGARRALESSPDRSG
jgi:glucokinase